MINELRILPPLAIARFGAAPTPMDNYDAVVTPDRPLGHRRLVPAETLRVDPVTGAIAEVVVPAGVAFKENGLVRPVAPFLELWAVTDAGQLEPVTTTMLEADGVTAADVQWQVHVANLKAARRTGDPDDRIEVKTGFFSDHEAHELHGTSPNFWPGKSIPFGHARYIKPTGDHPEIRLRFTPGPGHVYGASTTPPRAVPADPNVVDVVYNGVAGRWLGHVDGRPARPGEPDPPPFTAPGGIYRSEPPGSGVSAGYLDDGCDGLVRARLTVRGVTLRSYARVGAGPPAYAPDSMPIRSVADELEQLLHGPSVDAGDATLERVEEIVRRAFETVRLMNTDAANRGGMAGHDSDGQPLLRSREAIMARSLTDDVALENLHRSLLVALRSGAAPWFADVLREPEDIVDLTDRGRRKMPAMMRGADGRHLTRTRRQIELFRMLVRGPVFEDEREGEQ
jgi:hypothetical protein